MKRKGRITPGKIGFFLIAATVFVLWGRVQSEDTVILPAGFYGSQLWKEKAVKYQANFSRIQNTLKSRWSAEQFRFLAAGESSVGGLGFWPNPLQPAGQNRYLGIAGRMMIIPAYLQPFGDSEGGRLQSIMDAYGKHIIKALAAELKNIPDSEVAGGVIIFIYSKEPVSSPTFEQTAEAFIIFMPKNAVLLHADLRMTNRSLFDQSNSHFFRGPEQIRILRQNFITP